MDIDDKIKMLNDIFDSYQELCAKRGEDVSEEDTRANVIDQIIHNVLEWPSDAVYRETYANNGYLDYELITGRSTLVIEAKKSGKSFVFPYKKKQPKVYKISGVLSINKVAREAIEQTQKYCMDKGIAFGLTTNGYTWILFRAIIEGMPWRDESAYVFYSPKDIISRFNEFWNILSFPAVSEGKLKEHFTFKRNTPRVFHRPIDEIIDADAEYGRNNLERELLPFIDKFFGDIVTHDKIQLLEHCYVHSRPIQIIDEGIKIIIEDTIPDFACNCTEQLKTTPYSQGGELENTIRNKITVSNKSTTKDRVILLMGGIGSGKSTFLNRFFKIIIPDLLRPNGPIFDIYINFLGAPDSVDELGKYLWNNLKDAIRAKLNTINIGVLKEIFESELKIIQTIYENNANLERMFQDKIYELCSDAETFSISAIKYLIKKELMPVIIFDNVDQMAFDAQVHIFTVAQRLSKNYECISIIALREESFCNAQMQKHLTAYNIRSYHLSSPRFTDLLELRLDFASKDATDALKNRILTQEGYLGQKVLDFFRMLRESIYYKDNRYLSKLIESISCGNMRLALSLLKAFMASGATDINKILDKFNAGGPYLIPFHEFTKSIILGEYRFYKETRSLILNLFNVSDHRNSSHFTMLRILQYLYMAKKAQRGPEGFVNIQTLLTDIIDIFDNENDCVWAIMQLLDLRRQLIELNTRRTDKIIGASSVRITAAGIYYLKIFVCSFAYLDLMWHDTPFNDEGIADVLKRRMHETDMLVRFKRTETFLDYLAKEEEKEFSIIGLNISDANNFYGPFIHVLKKGYLRDKQKICHKLNLQS